MKNHVASAADLLEQRPTQYQQQKTYNVKGIVELNKQQEDQS